MTSSQILNSKNNNKINLNNYVNDGQENWFRSTNNNALYKNIVYKRKFEK